MAVFFLFGGESGGVERYELGRALPLGMDAETFSGGADAAWSDMRLLRAYEQLCASYGARIYVGGSFRRACGRAAKKGGAHYFGLALHLGGDLPPGELKRLRSLAAGSGLFSFVEAPYSSPRWVHAEIDPSGGRHVKKGDCSVCVMTLQDILLALGLPAALTGWFDSQTETLVRRFQSRRGIPVTGEADTQTWKALFDALFA